MSHTKSLRLPARLRAWRFQRQQRAVAKAEARVVAAKQQRAVRAHREVRA